MSEQELLKRWQLTAGLYEQGLGFEDPLAQYGQGKGSVHIQNTGNVVLQGARTTLSC